MNELFYNHFYAFMLWPGKLSLITHAESKPDLVHNVTQRPLCGLQPVSIQQWGLFPGTDKKNQTKKKNNNPEVLANQQNGVGRTKLLMG